jgi:hypothetical protein
MLNPMKILPYAAGGLLGGKILSSVFGGDSNKKKTPAAPAPVRTTQGVVGPAPEGY